MMFIPQRNPIDYSCIPIPRNICERTRRSTRKHSLSAEEITTITKFVISADYRPQVHNPNNDSREVTNFLKKNFNKVFILYASKD